MWCEILCSFAKTEHKALRATCATFGLVFKAFWRGQKLWFILFGDNELNLRKNLNQLFKCIKTPVKLLFWLNIGVVKEGGHIKSCRQILNWTTKARRTTHLQQKPWLWGWTDVLNLHDFIIASTMCLCNIVGKIGKNQLCLVPLKWAGFETFCFKMRKFEKECWV